VATTYPWDTQGDEAQDQPTPSVEQAPEDTASVADPTAELLAEIRAARNQMAYVQRRLDKQERDGLPLRRADRETLISATSRLEQAEESRRLADMTDEEQRDYYRDKAEKAEKARSQPAAVDVDRADPAVIEQLGEYFDDYVTAELREMADDMGLKLSNREIGVLRQYGVQQVPIGKDGTADWATWLRKEARPAMRAEVKRQAGEAKSPTGPQRGTPSQGALGGTSRGGGGANPGGMTWGDAQKIKRVEEISDADYERLISKK
jgi:hypothetical protein